MIAAAAPPHQWWRRSGHQVHPFTSAWESGPPPGSDLCWIV